MSTDLRVGFVGLGKLGLPCAAALSASTGKTVHGFDINQNVREYITRGSVPYMEKDVEKYLRESKIKFHNDIDSVVQNSDLIFVAVQTPHDPEYEGISPVPSTDKDFDYSYLENSVSKIVHSVSKIEGKRIDLVIISTVLPGTLKARIFPLIPNDLTRRINLIYNPFFIAMGTTISDYLNPEFVLIGKRENQSVDNLTDLYQEFIKAPIRVMKIESAELTKVAYNTFIGFKIIFSNTLSEIVQHIGGDVDEVTSALASSTQRIISNKYLRAGMADGGGCHPRDQIAMSWLAENLSLGYNPFRWIAETRDSQTKNQALLIKNLYERNDLPVVIMGRAYKKNINLDIGSPAVLLSNFLNEMKIPHVIYDPLFDKYNNFESSSSAIFFIATDHDVFKEFIYPAESICVDPWGDMVSPHNENIKIIKPGRNGLDFE